MVVFEYMLWYRIPFSEITISLKFLKAIFINMEDMHEEL